MGSVNIDTTSMLLHQLAQPLSYHLNFLEDIFELGDYIDQPHKVYFHKLMSNPMDYKVDRLHHQLH